MTLLKKISLIILTLLVVLIGLLQIDDKLQPETKTWIEETQKAVNTNNEAYFYFLGLMAPEDKDPTGVGKAIHKEVKAQPLERITEESAKTPQETAEYSNIYTIENGLKVSPEDTICRVFEERCFTKLLNNKPLVQKLVNLNSVLHKRYQTFLAMPDYQLMHPIGNWRDMPYYQHLVEANNISLINLLNVQDEETLNQKYSKLLEATRLKLTQSGSLIEKMIYVAVVNQNLEFYNLLYKHRKVNSPIEFSWLTQSEKDMQRVLSYELLASSAMMNNFEFEWYNLINKAQIKKNIILNKQHQLAIKYGKLSRLPAHQQIDDEIKAQYKPEKTSFLEKYRNYAGWILLKVSEPIYDDYIYRVSDLDAKISVLNWRLQQPQDIDIDESYLSKHDTAKFNPYTTGSFFIKKEETEKQKYLCIPLELQQDYKNVRCVQL